MTPFSRQLVVFGTSAAALWYVTKVIRTGGVRFQPKSPFLLRRRKAHIKPVSAAATGAPAGGLTVSPAQYPKVRRNESVVDNLHGVKVADPYRWLEDPDSEDTKAFVDAQNELTQSVLKQCDTRDQFAALMQQLYDYPKYGTPQREGSRFYYYYNSGLQAQSVLYTQKTLDGKATVLVDPNKMSDDGTIAMMGTAFSKDGRLFAYSLSSGGTDWRTVKFLSIDQETGATTDLEDELTNVKFSSLAWTHDHKGVFYNIFEPPAKAAGEQGTETDINLGQQLVYHVLGTPQSEDTVILTAPKEHPTWMLAAQITDDGRYLFISVGEGCEPVNRLWYIDLDQLPRNPDTGVLDLAPFDTRSKGAQQLPLVKLVDNFDAQYEYVANEGSSFTFMTNLDAPRYRVLRTDLADPGPPDTWADVVPQNKDLLQWASALKGDSLVVCYLRDVRSVLELRSLESGNLRSVLPLPGIGSVAGFSGRREYSSAFFKFTSFTEPGAIYRFDADQPQQEPKIFRRVELQCAFSPDDFETRQEFYHSKDGTRIPIFIVSKKGVQRTGMNPTLLYGYGGFNISLEPGFSVSRLAWMLAYNGVYAVANLRGGGEYGREWRDAGSRENKQNVFDDFQAAAEHLISQGYCSPETLAIQGGSNGGLLVAACANQRPDLYAAVLAQVGVMDMLRFHKFTIGHAWVSDYLSSDDVDGFEVLYAYSPLHNVRRPLGGSRQYPAMLVTTGDHDDRVVPLHSHKLTATLQHTLAGSDDSPQTNPLISRIEVRAGHGAGKPTEKIISEAADVYGFAAAAMKAPWVGLGIDIEPPTAHQATASGEAVH